jgi:hypothetical protein
MKILLGDLNTKVGREDILKPIIGNERSHEISNEPLLMERHHQIDHILIEMRRNSSILDVRSFREADCDSDHYLVVAKVGERLAVKKRMVMKMDVERFYLNQLNDEEVKEQYQVTIKNNVAALENLDDNGDINRGWETIRENIRISVKQSIGFCESKSYKPWFDEECLKLVDRRKQAKLQWLQDPSIVNGDNLHNVRREASRRFRNKKREGGRFISVSYSMYRGQGVLGSLKYIQQSHLCPSLVLLRLRSLSES